MKRTWILVVFLMWGVLGCQSGGPEGQSTPTETVPTATPTPLVKATPTATHTPTPTPTSESEDVKWTVVEERSWLVAELGGFPLSLSPDGRWLLTGGRDGFCLHATDNPTQRRCYAPGEKAAMTSTAPGAAAWSPDGQRLAFRTADALWLLEVENGDPIRLTPLEERVDMAWSPDGEMLALAGEGVITVAPPGGVAEAPTARYRGIIVGLAWAGSTSLVYGVRQGQDFALWQVSTTGGEPREVWRFPDPNLRVKETSPDGKVVSLWLTLVDLERGETVEVRKGFLGLEWSPDGRWWLYAYPIAGLEPLSRLAIRRAESSAKEEQIVWHISSSAPRLLDWTRVDDLVLLCDGHTVWLLRLAAR